MIGMEAFSLSLFTLKRKISTNTILNLFSFNPSKIIGITPNPIIKNNEAELISLIAKRNGFFEKHIKSMSKNTHGGGKMKGKLNLL